MTGVNFGTSRWHVHVDSIWYDVQMHGISGKRHPSEAEITVCRNVILIIATKADEIFKK
jgi:hypothetical protein